MADETVGHGVQVTGAGGGEVARERGDGPSGSRPGRSTGPSVYGTTTPPGGSG
ncbi:hypothetical protein ACFW2X_18750 [Streptomyces antibioticus]|uniref:hypothetical protein n=1 Tax=Streptomyces antibioticus TaxID=1890 RepID=UPI0036BEEC78